MGPVAEAFLLSFIPLLVATDPIGTLPFVVALGEGMETRERRRMVNIGMATAAAVAFFFLFLGRGVLGLLGISVGHFAIAGGLVLLALSIKDLVTGRMVEAPHREEMVAVVPIGTPLTVGPAVVTTLLLLTDEYGLPIVLVALLVTLALAWLVFWFGQEVMAFLGEGGVRAVSKVASLFLAAIAVRMVLRGLDLTLPGLFPPAGP